MNEKIISLLFLMAVLVSGRAWADGEMKPGPDTYGKSATRYPDWRFDGPDGRGFAYYLAHNYWRYGKQEDNEHDFINSAKFFERAAATERGEHIDPEALSQRTLPIYAVKDLTQARDRLMAVLNKGARSTYPKPAAQAQVMFDCWMEQQEENIQPHDVHACRQGFEEAMARMEPPPMPPLAQPAPPPPAPMPPAMCPEMACAMTPAAPISFIVYFDFDRYNLTAKAQDIVQQVVAAIRERNPAHVVITGHTDRAGSDSYNDKLSRRRLDTVIAALRQAGITEPQLIDGSYYGEHRNRVPTPDGERNAENRRVEINFQ